MDEQNNEASILAKFQQINNEKEQAKHDSVTTKPFGLGTSSDREAINNSLKRKTIEENAEENNKKFQGEDLRKSKNEPTNLHKGLSEEQGGITEYVNSSSKGFSGIIKHRFSDFQVHEIDLKGNVVELKCLDLPKLPKEWDTKTATEHRSVLSETIWKQVERILNDRTSEEYVEMDVSDKDKPARTVIHKALKFVFGTQVFSNTVTRDDKMILRIGKARNTDRRNEWPANLGNHLHFTVYKENMDTTNVVSLIAKKLKMKKCGISYSGTKDKRAVTTQRMSIRRRRPEFLHGLKFFQFTLGDYAYEQKSLRLGDLSGNRFTIAIRNVDAPDAEINNSLSSIKENGFVNYYGLQRFGSSLLAPTFECGKAILLKDWKKAVETILQPRKGERVSHKTNKAREIWWSSRNPRKALRFLPKYDNSIEGKVLRALKAQGKDQYYNALFAIPRNTMLLYVHAYQSLIWNKVVSKRIREFGLKPMVGDLVLIDGSDENVEEAIVEGSDDDGEGGGGEEEEVDKEEEEKNENEKSPKEKMKSKYHHQKVRKLTSEDLAKTTFNEIVLPLPGHDIQYPDNETAKWYSELLAEDGLSLDDFKTANSAFALFGSYRKIIGRVDDLTWEIVFYNSVNDNLILSDLDKLRLKSLPKQPEYPQYKAVIMDFKLNPSHYATMLLREAMKCETAGSYHAALTKSSHRNNK